MIVQVKQAFSSSLSYGFFVFEDSWVDREVFEYGFNLQSMVQFLLFAVDEGKVEDFGGLGEEKGKDDASEESIVVDWRISQHKAVDWLYWFTCDFFEIFPKHIKQMI